MITLFVISVRSFKGNLNSLTLFLLILMIKDKEKKWNKWLSLNKIGKCFVHTANKNHITLKRNNRLLLSMLKRTAKAII